MKLAGEAATRMEQKLFLVGGVVRDLLLDRTNLDLDLVTEGDAMRLADELAKIKNGKVIAHSRFNTAKIKWDKWSVDIASARAESYDKPGSLPTVECHCDIQQDLIRRDFTINSMAVYLEPLRFGELIDLFDGRDDLKRGYIRVLHDDSFKDDATRIWRAVRYEQRLSFVIEHYTLGLLKRDISYLDTISGDRIRNELELVLKEEKPEKALLRADELGVLARMCPQMKADDWVAKKITKARGIMEPYCPPEELYLAFLVYRLTPEGLDDFIRYLKFPGTTVRVLQDTLSLKSELRGLTRSSLTPSRIYHLLHRFNQTAILANLMAAESPLVRQRIELYLNKLRHIQPLLTGEDLIQMGYAAGPRIKETLEALREARLDGKVSTREEETEIARRNI